MHCHAACGNPASWEPEVHVSGPFDARQAPFARGYFLGDYVGLSNSGASFAALFTEGVMRPADPSSEFYATISPS